MELNNEIIQKIQEKSKKSGTSYLDNFFKRNPQVKEYCQQFLNSNSWFQNIKNVFLAIGHNIFDTVLCRNCKQPLKVEKAIYGRHFYCCKKCADNSQYSKKLRQETCLKKYGSTTPLLNEECKKKSVKTCQEKYGNDMFAGSAQYKKRVPTPFLKQQNHIKGKETKIKKYGQDYGKVIFEKIKTQVQKRNLEKYGVPYLLMHKDILEKTHKTMKEKYGVYNYWSSKKCNKQRVVRSWKKIQNWKNIVIPMFSFEQYFGQNNTVYKWKCVKCGNEFQSRIYTTGLGNCRTIPRCEVCFPNNSVSIQERCLLQYLKTILKFQILHNVRIIKPYQLDIYIPQKNIAIQCDGIYWHSQKIKPSNYHLIKTELCNEKGIQLIHIFEDQWLYKQDIVKDRIIISLKIFK